MKNLKIKILLFVLTFLFLGCIKERGINSIGTGVSGGNSEWLVPASSILNGGPGRDGIPSIDDPKFISVSEGNKVIGGSNLVLIVKEGRDIKIYPHFILDYHEIVNDFIGDKAVAITYCPLTGTAMCWSRTINGEETTFGVSGLLYLSNLIPYDRLTGSEWSQMRAQSIHGSNLGNKAEVYPIIETEWNNAKLMYPTAQVLSTNTGKNLPYGNYPYGDYKTNDNNILFPISPVDNRIPLKERVLGIRKGEKVKAYKFSSFTNSVEVINDVIDGHPIVVIGSHKLNMLLSYERVLEDGTELEFTLVEDSFPAELLDQFGNKWDIFGKALEGSRSGETLNYIQSLIGYWFTFGSFFPEPEIYE
jgi:hypothetical protein